MPEVTVEERHPDPPIAAHALLLFGGLLVYVGAWFLGRWIGSLIPPP